MNPIGPLVFSVGQNKSTHTLVCWLLPPVCSFS
jgi:hypothetical protein